MLSTKKTHFSFHEILAFATAVNLVQLECVFAWSGAEFFHARKYEIVRVT